MKNFCRLISAIVLMCVFSLMAFAQTPPAGEVALQSRDVRPVAIQPGTASTLISFVVETGGDGGDVFQVISTDPGIIITLILPNGTEVNSSNASNLGYNYSVTPASDPDALTHSPPSPFLGAGTHTVIELPQSASPGNYQVKANALAATKPALVIASYYSSSSIRLGVTINEETYKVGETVVVSAFVFNGTSPITNASLNAEVRDSAIPSTSIRQLTFLDGGQYDEAPGDGIYTASFVADQAGRFSVGVRATGVSSSGNNYARVATTSFRVTPAAAGFTSFSAAGIDDNANGLTDRIEVTANLNVQTASRYLFIITLEGADGKSTTRSNEAALSAGSQQLKISFPALEFVNPSTGQLRLGTTGPFAMKQAELRYISETDVFVADSRESVGNTGSYTFERDGLFFTGQPTLFEEDANANGKLDSLRLQMSVNVLNAGNYQWTAVLIDPSGQEIQITLFPADAPGPLPAGINNINFRFDGRNIRRKGLNGPYTVKKITIYGEGKSATLSNVLTTRAFLSTDFEQPIVLNCANITASLPTGQSSGPVNYTLPTVSFNTFITNVSCLPTPGATFQVGTTQVNCTATENLTGYTANCSFTLTVNNQADTTPPTITCPVNVYGVIPYGSGSGPVNYPAPVVSDDRAGVTFSCSQPSGSNFFRGATTVTCTATDAAGNQASCNFTVRVFDVSLQDNQLKHTLWFDSISGDYYFFSCDASGYTLAGRGTITRQGCNTMLGGDPRVSATFTACVVTPSVRYGNAVIKPNPVGGWFYITDSDANNNLPSCPIG